MWRNFGEILESFGGISGNSGKFWEILAKFTPFHVEKN